MPQYEPELSLGQARARYFERNGLGEEGYRSRWIRLKAGPLVILLPNTAGRVRAVKLHDLHHVLTEYDTSWRGEAEIGAWEVATGCGRHLPAWVLNLNAMAVDLFVGPGRVYRAFLRGRRSRSLYAGQFREEMLDLEVGATRRELAIPAGDVDGRWTDRVLFVAWSVAAIVTLLLPYALAAAVLAVLLGILR